MTTIPKSFAGFMIKLFGETGRIWLENLPALLALLEQQWNVKILGPVDRLSFNYVARAVTANGTEVIVKTGLTDEFLVQPAALRYFHGQGAILLLEYDQEHAAMLLEYLPQSVSLLSIADDTIAVNAAIGVMRKLWRPLPPQHAPFPTVQDWQRSFHHLRDRFQGGSGPLPASLVDCGEKLYDELCASMDDVVLLHGDLHQDNILRAIREPWLAIDPKGVIGEPAFETGSMLRNFWPDILSVKNPRLLIAHRIDQFAAELGFDRQRVHGWGLAQAILSMIWGLEDTGEVADEGMFFAELLSSLPFA